MGSERARSSSDAGQGEGHALSSPSQLPEAIHGLNLGVAAHSQSQSHDAPPQGVRYAPAPEDGVSSVSAPPAAASHAQAASNMLWRPRADDVPAYEDADVEREMLRPDLINNDFNELDMGLDFANLPLFDNPAPFPPADSGLSMQARQVLREFSGPRHPHHDLRSPAMADLGRRYDGGGMGNVPPPGYPSYAPMRQQPSYPSALGGAGAASHMAGPGYVYPSLGQTQLAGISPREPVAMPMVSGVHLMVWRPQEETSAQMPHALIVRNVRCLLEVGVTVVAGGLVSRCLDEDQVHCCHLCMPRRACLA